MLGCLGLVAAGLSGVATVPGVTLPPLFGSSDRPAPASSPNSGSDGLDAAAGGMPRAQASVAAPARPVTAPAPSGPSGPPGMPAASTSGVSGPLPVATVVAVSSTPPRAVASPKGQGQGQGRPTEQGRPTSKPSPSKP